ncbi:hypothetical protein MRB53_041404 [Persea americana]|nr:hypothetical protein MRB53_041404 [Persea americana]
MHPSQSNPCQGLGTIAINMKSAEAAYVGAPLLVAIGVGIMRTSYGADVPLIAPVIESAAQQPLMLMARMIGDELEPTIRVKLWNTQIEYSAALIKSLMEGPSAADESAPGSAASISSLGHKLVSDLSSPISSISAGRLSDSRRLKVDVVLRDSAIGLRPRDLSAKGLFVLTDSRISTTLPIDDTYEVLIEIRKAEMLLIDGPVPSARGQQVTELCKQGYVATSFISKATAKVVIARGIDESDPYIDVDFRDEFFVLETCADSTRTIDRPAGQSATLNAAQHGHKVSHGRWTIQLEDMLASFTGDAFAVKTETRTDKHVLDDEDDDLLDTDFDCLGDLPSGSKDEVDEMKTHSRTASMKSPFHSLAYFSMQHYREHKQDQGRSPCLSERHRRIRSKARSILANYHPLSRSMLRSGIRQITSTSP